MLRSLRAYNATRRLSQTVRRAAPLETFGSRHLHWPASAVLGAARQIGTFLRSVALAGAVLAAFVLAGAVLACGAVSRPCRSPSACPAGSECLADRCVLLGAEPVDPRSRRLVLDPVAIAVVRSEASRQAALPPTVTLGGPQSQDEQLLVRFSHAWGELDIDSAFLLLEPALDAEPTSSDVEIAVALAEGTWRSGILTSAPASRGPTSTGIGRTRPPALLRVDVTAQLRELARQPRGDRGLLVRATRPSPRGAIYSTGIDGTAPRLDVYFLPRRTIR
jgi:hypothetical protein